MAWIYEIFFKKIVTHQRYPKLHNLDWVYPFKTYSFVYKHKKELLCLIYMF